MGRLETGFGPVWTGLDVGDSTFVLPGVSGVTEFASESAMVLEFEFESVLVFVSTATSLVGEGIGVASTVGSGEGVGSTTTVAEK